MTNYLVQQICGGWRQPAIFEGTLEECESYVDANDTGGGWSLVIVSQDEYEVDYLS